MRPAARLAAAIEALTEIERTAAPPDRVLAAWGRANRYAGAKDRAAIGDIVHDCLRRRRSLCWPLRDDGPRAAVMGWALAQGGDVAALFDGARHAPAPLTAEERAALADPPPPPPDPVRLDYPDWLDGPLREGLGDAFEASMTALQSRAPVDLRVNLLKADRAAAQAALAAEGIETVPGPHADTCLRAAPGARVAATAAYRDGLVELQDAASQAVADFTGARPGETVLDFCAGGGGKTLALAARMNGAGALHAHDADPGRMRDLPARLRRAGARAAPVAPSELPALAGRCDRVLVDAPCSGSGSWRRDPAGKWRLTPERLAALTRTQAAILAEAARCLRPGGALVYATCSVLTAENAAPAAETLRLTPADGADGFHAARVALRG